MIAAADARRPPGIIPASHLERRVRHGRKRTLATVRQAQHDALGVEAGGFVSYRLAHNLGLSSRLLYGGGNDNRGVRFTASANYGIDLSAHQSLWFNLGVTAANASYMDSYFGVAPMPGRAHPSGYRPGGGLKNLFAGVYWNVELSTKYSVTTGFNESRLAGPAADSPLVTSPHNVSLFTQLTYHF